MHFDLQKMHSKMHVEQCAACARMNHVLSNSQEITMTTSSKEGGDQLKSYDPQTAEQVKADFDAGKTLPTAKDHDVKVMTKRFEAMGLPSSTFEKICKDAGL
jgi:hypothetical protein